MTERVYCSIKVGRYWWVVQGWNIHACGCQQAMKQASLPQVWTPNLMGLQHIILVCTSIQTLCSCDRIYKMEMFQWIFVDERQQTNIVLFVLSFSYKEKKTEMILLVDTSKKWQ